MVVGVSQLPREWDGEDMNQVVVASNTCHSQLQLAHGDSESVLVCCVRLNMLINPSHDGVINFKHLNQYIMCYNYSRKLFNSVKFFFFRFADEVSTWYFIDKFIKIYFKIIKYKQITYSKKYKQITTLNN